MKHVKPSKKKAQPQSDHDQTPPLPQPEILCAHDALVPLADLRPHPRNPNTHPRSQIEALARVISANGWRHPVVVSERSGLVVAGHGRMLAAAMIGCESVPVDYQSFESEERELAVLVSDNVIAELAEMDDDALAAIVRDLDAAAASFDIPSALGMRANDIESILVGDGGGDDQPPPPLAIGDAVTRRGDILVLGGHRIMCGDSGSAQDLDALLDGAMIHLLNTDPPYNVGAQPRSSIGIHAGNSSFPQSSTGANGRGKVRAKDRRLYNDSVSSSSYIALLQSWFSNAARAMRKGAAFYVWGGYANVATYPPALVAAHLYFSQAIIWVKGHPVINRKDFMAEHEWCFYGWKEGAAHRFFGPNNVPDVWHVKKVNPQSMVHLTEKPAELAKRAMAYSTKVGENVLDLFGGSGSTMIAAEEMGRRAFLMELDPHYCDVIVRRWLATHGADGQPRTVYRNGVDVTDLYLADQGSDQVTDQGSDQAQPDGEGAVGKTVREKKGGKARKKGGARLIKNDKTQASSQEFDADVE